MPSFERELPPSDRHLRHQHSASSSALVPMWDSSDPDRAPPPLPLNPVSPGERTSRAGTSLAIQNAHAALTEKARENAREHALVPVLHKRNTDISPERGLVQRPSPHKRMQSMQPGSVRDLSLMIEGSRGSANSTPRGSPEKERFARPETPTRNREPEKEAKSSEKDSSIGSISIPAHLTPAMRPSSRWQQHSILGENTPPQSATMMALQNMSSPAAREIESPLATVTNNATAPSQPHDQLSNQLLTLTNIATALQKEMAALSRRSRDNATDLMSLKEATHARDEDIRKTLRDLASNPDSNRLNRDTYNGGLYLDNKAFNSSTSPVQKSARPYALPRIPSPNSFAASLDRESILSTPSLVGGASETPATMALLEKIIREMGTKDGNDMMMDRLSELAEKLVGMASATKVEELLTHVKTMRQEQAIVPARGNAPTTSRSLSFDSTDDVSENYFQHSGAMGQHVERLLGDSTGRRASAPGRPNDVLNDEVIKIIRSVKDSVAAGGGLTAEVKALVRELRGEVLGMGRELGRKLEETGGGKAPHTSSKGEPSKAELARIVEEGLDQMKVYMQQRLREHRRESNESEKSVIDYQEIYNAMRTAISDAHANKPKDPKLSRDDVLNAVKDAWENYKPEISIEQVGLERDEVLACIKEGLQEFAPQQEFPETATREEVFTAVVEGMKHFVPPKIDTPETLSRDEVLEAVRECLEEFEFPVAPSPERDELTREDVLHATKQALDEFDFPDPTTALVAHDAGNSEIVERLHDIMQYMQDEFKTATAQAKQSLADNERDTEQVLQATKDSSQQVIQATQDGTEQVLHVAKDSTEQVLDATKAGFETLRAHIEGYVEKMAENSGSGAQEELMENLVNGLEGFRDELSELITKSSDGSRDHVKQEIESLRDAVNSQLVPHVPPPVDNKEALEAIREGLERVRGDLMRPHAGTTDILDALSEGFSEIRTCIEKVNDKPVDLTANDEILDALKSGLDDVRADIDTLRGGSDKDKALITVNNPELDNVTLTDLIRHDDIKNIEHIMTDLQMKMQTIELAQPAASTVSAAPAGGLSKEDLAEMEQILRNGVSKTDLNEMEERLRDGVNEKTLNEMEELLRQGVSKEDLNQMEEILRSMQESMAGMTSASTTRDIDSETTEKPEKPEKSINLEDGATKEDVQAIETILRNTKGRLDDLIDGEQAVRKDHVDGVEALVLETKESLGNVTSQLENISRKEDLLALESLVTQITVALDEMKERAEKSLEDPEKVTKTHVDTIELTVYDIKALLEKIANTDIAALPSKDDLNKIEEVVRDIKAYNSEELPSREDWKAVEDVVRNIKDYNVESLVSKDDLKLVEHVVMEIKDHSTTLPSKDDFKAVEEIVKEIKDHNAAQAEANSTALANRQTEVISVNERVAEVKEFLQDFQAMAKERLETGGNGVETIGWMLEGLGETINKNATVGSDVQEMFELMKAEFEETRASMVGSKLDTDEKLKETTDLLNEQITGKIGELVTKYEEFQLVMEDRTKAGEARDLEMEAAVVGNKAVTEELKVLIDTLGSTVTDSLEKMEEASKTVFDKVEMLYSKAEDSHLEDKAEHQMTREQVKEAIGVVEGLQGQVTDYHPKLLDAVKDVLLVVGQHFEHSKNSTSDIQKCIEDAKPPPLLELLPPPPKEYDDTEVRSKLDSLNTEVHSKLDKLVDHTHAAGKAYSQLDTLDKVHQQVVKTAADINQFLATQKQRIESEHEDRAKTLQEQTIALELQRAEQEHVNSALAVLRDEEAQLRESVLSLRTEQEFLTRQKTRLTADVSSLETALHLRREELHAMDVRAEGLERRILEGVLDHSRALLITKSSTKGRDAMSRKRVARSSLGGSELPNAANKPLSNKPRAAVNMAVNGNRASLVPNPAGASRRILSLSQITNNVPTGGLNRSQSVRTAAARKRSWGPEQVRGGKGYGDLDKENVDSVREMDEDGRDDDGDADDYRDVTPKPDIPTPVGEEDEAEAAASDADTLRRSSLGTTVVTGTETEGGYSGYSDDDGYSDRENETMSECEWTESNASGSTGRRSGGGRGSYGSESIVSESVADSSESIAGEGEVVVYAGRG